MRKIVNTLFYISSSIIPISFILYSLNLIGSGFFLLSGLVAFFIYFGVRTAFIILNRDRDRYTIIYFSLFMMSLFLFTRYYHFKFGDILGLIVLPFFLYTSIRYIIENKSNLNLKIIVSIVLYSSLSIPLFLTMEKGPRKFIPEEWRPQNIEQIKYRNQNWSWWFDLKKQKGMWIPISDTTTFKTGYYTLFFSNGNIREKGKLKEGRNIDTVFIFDLKENSVYSYKS